MKNFKFIIVFLILLSCLSNKKYIKSNSIKENELEFELLNKSISDSSSIEIIVKNNSIKNYYLQFDVSKFNEPITFFSTEYLHNIDVKMENEEGMPITYKIVDYTCYWPKNKIIYRTSKSVRNIFKIKSGKKKTIYKLFRMKTKVNENCWYEFQKKNMDKEKKHYLTVEYKMFGEIDYQIIPKVVKDSLQQMGYEFYDKKIVSNKVLLNIN